ncbi:MULTISPECIES: tyrosine-type recombinase/integrase [unclassified Anabaena]|uniref:tyrosine-type recombinase/integrase n=1 Tax=unclassified Anabaena TaxID=2619674 RepID=UPI0039C76171
MSLSAKTEYSLTWRNAYDILKRACEQAGFASKGISTHTSRRSFITKLHRNGIDPYKIKKITGYRDFKALERYIDIDPIESRSTRPQSKIGKILGDYLDTQKALDRPVQLVRSRTSVKAVKLLFNELVQEFCK